MRVRYNKVLFFYINLVPRTFFLVGEVGVGYSIITAQGPQDPGDEVGTLS